MKNIRRDAAKVLAAVLAATAPAMGPAFAQEADYIGANERQPIVDSGIIITPSVARAQELSNRGIVLYIAGSENELPASMKPLRELYQDFRDEGFPFQIIPEVSDQYDAVQMRIIHYGGIIEDRNWNPEEVTKPEFERTIRQEYASDQRARQVILSSDDQILENGG